MGDVQHQCLLFEESAKHFGYYPWIQFSFVQWLVFRKMIKAETFELMNSRLADPTKANPVWAIQFAKAIEAIGLATCKAKAPEDFHRFVCTHNQFRKQLPERHAYKRAVKKQRWDMEPALAMFMPEDAAIIRKDLARVVAFKIERIQAAKLRRKETHMVTAQAAT